MNSVGSELLNEIERVSAKRERWKGYGVGASGAPGIALMTHAITRGKEALVGDDPAEGFERWKNFADSTATTKVKHGKLPMPPPRPNAPMAVAISQG